MTPLVPSADAASVTSFDFTPLSRVVFGAGAVQRLGQFAVELGGRRVLFVTDKGLARAGYEQRGVDALQSGGLQVIVFDDVHSEPTTADVERGLAVARSENIDLIVGFGGGSSMDCAKGINFLLTNGGRMEDYWGVGKASKPMLPLIAVPTTAGTGSEAQSFAIIASSTTHMKMACGDKKAAAKIAILDPELTLTMPRAVTAATGIDAISHAVEAHVTKARTTMSQLFSRRAWQLLSRGLPQVLTLAGDAALAARGDMLLGAHLAGAAIENSMLGATHSLANPLSAHFGVTHGVAVGLMLPHVIRFNASAVGPLYGELAADAGLCAIDDPRAGSILAEHIARLFASAGLPTSLSACHVTRELIPIMASEAAAQWTAKFNPRPVDVVSLQELYECAM
ncbi:MAG: iron-containing alcohol dehydrogenase [Planctomycetia bacterium]|nr:iron-containing alcohol dehydrogenase [Planctomycetia bacterium]